MKENIVFPYLRSMAHAYESKESYGGLMVRTLQKPVTSIIPRQREKLVSILLQMATLTKNYTAPAAACTSHKVTFYKLQQLAQNLQQQLYLEYAVLYPRALAMEKELLAQPAAQIK